MPIIKRKLTCVSVLLPVSKFCDICKPLMDPLSNTRKRSSKVCLWPWDISIWGDHKHISKVKHCDEVRQYLELNHNNVFFEDSPAYPNQCYNDMDVKKNCGD